jgi:pimeloyl-ACP methyl ester carboxylesterase
MRDAYAAFDRGAAYCLASAFQATFRGAPDTASRRAPGLVAWGSRDRTHRKSDPKGARAYLDGASVTELGVGHFPDLEAPEAFAAALKRAVT